MGAIHESIWFLLDRSLNLRYVNDEYGEMSQQRITVLYACNTLFFENFLEFASDSESTV
jgi:hypothetical protein